MLEDVFFVLQHLGLQYKLLNKLGSTYNEILLVYKGEEMQEPVLMYYRGDWGSYGNMLSSIVDSLNHGPCIPIPLL